MFASRYRSQGLDVTVIDAEAEELTIEQTVERVGKAKNVLLMAMGQNPSASSTPKMDVVIELAKRLKNVNIAGLHPSALPERTGDETEVGVITGIPFTTLYPVAWDLLPMDRYIAHNWHCLDGSPRKPYASIYTSLGCPYSCSFCNIHALYGDRRVRYRKPEDVVSELDVLVNKHKVRNIKIADELFTLNKKHVGAICDLIIERNYDLNMWAYARVGTLNVVLLEKMRRAGIRWLGFGFESSSPRVLKGVGKRYRDIEETIAMTRQVGINIMGNFVFGLPDDDWASMRATLNWAKAECFDFVNFYVAMAYPGSKLYEDAVKNDISLPETWDAYSQFSPNIVPLPTRYLKGQDVLKFRDEAFIEYFSNPRYLEMIDKKFGARAEIESMLRWKPKRQPVL